MERTDLPNPPARDDAVVEALLAPSESSFLDALLVLADEAANAEGPDTTGRAFQAALARKMRDALGADHRGQEAA
ncbi:hypothetical protein FY036_20715 [Mesorhizobium microcysteis]|uniref:Uncharacterized protein n=2 Tax=Neoaquamicrobium microcysteis TaxID=2682781 RepID=A0A5D4GQ60_9HYPH|nr:hypothetical protein FY036_20715 [Mesorhizobium microcysteis]